MKLPPIEPAWERLPDRPHLFRIYDATALGDLAAEIFEARPNVAEVSFQPKEWAIGGADAPDDTVCIMAMDHVDLAGCIGPAGAHTAMGWPPPAEPPPPADPSAPEVIEPPATRFGDRLPDRAPEPAGAAAMIALWGQRVRRR